MINFHNFLSLLTIAIAGEMSAYASANEDLKADRLTCEYRMNPLGIDPSTPRLSWTLTSSVRNQFQSAYELIVSDNEKDIQQFQGNVWKTGKISSSENIHIQYKG